MGRKRKKILRKAQDGNMGKPFDLNMDYLTDNFSQAEIDTILGGMYNAGSDYLGGRTGHWGGRKVLDAATFTGLIPAEFEDLLKRGKTGWRNLDKNTDVDDIDAMRVLLESGVSKHEILKWFSEKGVQGDIFPGLSSRRDVYTKKRGGSVRAKKIFKEGGNVGGAGGWRGRSVPGMKHGNNKK